MVNIYDNCERESMEVYSDLSCKMAAKILIISLTTEGKNCNLDPEDTRDYDTIKKDMEKLGIWQKGWDEEFENVKNGEGVNASNLVKMLTGDIL